MTERVFDPETGGLAHAVGPNNVLTHVERDADGAVTFIDPSGEDRGFGRFLDENGDEVTFDELRRGMGRSRYDARGNLLFVQHADGTCEEYDYDDRGLVRR